MNAAFLNRLCALCLAITVWTCMAVVSVAQSRDDPANADTEPRVGPVRRSNIEIFYFRTESGELVPVPSVTLQELQDLKLLKQNLIPRNTGPQRYGFQGDVEFSGTVRGTHAELQVTLQIRIRDVEAAASPDWIRIPLRMNRAILSPGADHEGAGRFLLSYEKEADGYVAWLRADANSLHTVKLKVKVPLDESAGRTQLSLVTPSVPTRFELTVPGQDLEFEVNNEEESILTAQPVGEATRLTLENVGGVLGLSWRPKKKTTPVLESTVTARHTINGQQLDCEATIKVRSYGAPINSIDVRLPPGLRIKPEIRPGLEVSEVAVDAETNSQIVRVERTDGKANHTLDVQLQALTLDAAAGDAGDSPTGVARGPYRRELAGFSVDGAVRQSGVVEVAVEGDWTVDWYPGKYVYQVAAYELVEEQDVVARFAYDRQPFSLKAEVARRQSRVRVDPVYILYIEEQELRLEATLRYRVRGATWEDLKVQASDWTIDRVYPDELVADNISLESNSPLSIPLQRGGPNLSDELLIQFEAHRPLEENQTSFKVLLPRTVGAVASPATLVVVPAENLQLAFRSAEIEGLIPETAPPEIELPDRQQPPSFFREELSTSASLFAAEFEVRAGKATIGVDSALRVTDTTALIEQRFEVQIAYERRSEFLFRAPVELTRPDRLQFFLDEQPLNFTVVGETAAVAGPAETPDEPSENPLDGAPSPDAVPPVEPPADSQGDSPDDSGEWVWLRVDLRQPRIKPCTLVGRYAVDLPSLGAGAPVAVSLPLIQPVEDAETSVARNRLRVSATDNVAVELQDDAWELVIEPNPLFMAAGERMYQAVTSTTEANCLLSLARTPRLQATSIEKAWIQTTLSQNLRQDRACFLVVTNEDRIRLALPEGAVLIALALNGLAQPAAAAPDGAVEIELEASNPAEKHTIEVWYRFSARAVSVSRLTVEPPDLLGVDEARRIYWQIVLPFDEHLFYAAPGLTPEYDWQWTSTFLGRRPNRSQADLESLFGASRQEAPPSAATNEYLFSSMGPIGPVEFLTIRRSVFALTVSLVVLGSGLMLLYVPSLRHPVMLMVSGVAVLAIGFTRPEAAILIGQAGTLGLALVLVASLLRWNLVRRHYRRPTHSSAGTFISDSRASEELSLRSGEGSSRNSTTVAPSALRMPVVEPKP